MESTSEPLDAFAEVVVRRYAAATNLLVASRSMAVRGDGEHALALAATLRRLGARVVHVSADGSSVTEAVHAEFVIRPAATTSPWTVPSPRAEHCAGPVIVEVLLPVRAEGAAVPTVRVLDPDGVELRAPRRRPAPAGDAVWRSPSDVAAQSATSAPSSHALAAGAEPTGEGRARIAWARRHMPLAAELAAELAASNAVRGLRVGLSLVLEPKTAVLALALAAAGADVAVHGRPEETREDVAVALRAAGLAVFADSHATPAQAEQLARDFLSRRHHLLLDDGSHLIRLAHQCPGTLDHLIGAAEETTSGLRPLREWEREGRLRAPVFAVNDARAKTLFDNAYGTGQSCLTTILDLLAPDGAAWPLSGKHVVVVGFGHVGDGLARHAAALGAHVAVAELDPIRALRAAYCGYQVGGLADLAGEADLIVSATGEPHTITVGAMLAAKPGATIAVAGGVDQEVSLEAALAAGACWEPEADRVERLVFEGGHAVRVLDRGSCINVTAGEGNPIEIMDLSFAVQLEAVRLLVERGSALSPGVHPMPADVDARIGRAALATLGMRIDGESEPGHE